MSNQNAYDASRDATFADDTSYILPNDAPEHERLDRQGQGLVAMMHGMVVHSPLKTGSKFLDVGCGTGSVCYHVATQDSQAQVVGVDLSPVPASQQTPQNITYVQGNVREMVGHHPSLQPGSFDVAFSRLLIWGMSDWPGYVQSMASLAKSGGHVEIQECDLNLFDYDKQMDMDSIEVMREFYNSCKANNMDFMCGTNVARYMQQAGLKNVQAKTYRLPFGTWLVKEHPETEKIGRVWEELHEGMATLMANKLLAPRLPKEKVDKLAAEATNELKARPGRYIMYTVTTGEKA